MPASVLPAGGEVRWGLQGSGVVYKTRTTEVPTYQLPNLASQRPVQQRDWRAACVPPPPWPLHPSYPTHFLRSPHSNTVTQTYLMQRSWLPPGARSHLGSRGGCCVRVHAACSGKGNSFMLTRCALKSLGCWRAVMAGVAGVACITQRCQHGTETQPLTRTKAVVRPGPCSSQPTVQQHHVKRPVRLC